jgi:hypothetical protein
MTTGEAASVALVAAIEQEATLLSELAVVAEAARGPGPGDPALAELLARQVELCERLEALGAGRRAFLARTGQRAKDFLVALLAELAPDQHPAAVAALDRQVAAAAAAARQIAINREFFGVMLAAVEDTLASVAGDGGRPVTYDARGERGLGARAVRLDRHLL